MNGNTGIRLSDMAFVVGIIDVLVVLSFIYMIVNIKISGRQAIHNIISNSLSSNLFTIEITNVPTKNMNIQQIIANLWDYYENYYNKIYQRKPSES
jgi:hypothetical protein